MPPLSVAALGWVVVILGVEPNGGAADVGADAVGWLLVAFGWHRLASIEARYVSARGVALVAAGVSALRLADLPDAALTLAYIASLMLVSLAAALGAHALLGRARAGGSALASGQASFLRWSAVGLLLAQCVGAGGLAVAPTFGGLVIAAAQLGLAVGAWFALLQLFCSGREWARPVRRRRG